MGAYNQAMGKEFICAAIQVAIWELQNFSFFFKIRWTLNWYKAEQLLPPLNLSFLFFEIFAIK